MSWRQHKIAGCGFGVVVGVGGGWWLVNGLEALSIPQLSYSQSVGGEGTNRHELPAADHTHVHRPLHFTSLTYIHHLTTLF